MQPDLLFDDIIFRLQRRGGASVYWSNVTQRVAASGEFCVRRTAGHKYARFLPLVTAADVMHSSHFRVPLSRKVRCVVTVYDFMYERGLVQTKGRHVNILERRNAIHRADAIICISESTARDLAQIYPVVTSSVPVHISPLAPSILRPAMGASCPSERVKSLISAHSERYVLYVGTRRHYKNFRVAVEGYALSRLPSLGYRLLCVGPALEPDEVQVCEALGIAGQLIAHEGATNDELAWLYSYAHALVYPSEYEGFGLPPLEAMNCGCPVIVSNSSSLLEVAGEAAIMTEVRSPGQVAAGLDALLDADVRAQRVQAGYLQAGKFSWDRCAREHIAVYKSLMHA